MYKKITIFLMALLCLYNTSSAQLDTTKTATNFTQQMDSFFLGFIISAFLTPFYKSLVLYLHTI